MNSMYYLNPFFDDINIVFLLFEYHHDIITVIFRYDNMIMIKINSQFLNYTDFNGTQVTLNKHCLIYIPESIFYSVKRYVNCEMNCYYNYFNAKDYYKVKYIEFNDFDVFHMYHYKIPNDIYDLISNDIKIKKCMEEYRCVLL